MMTLKEAIKHCKNVALSCTNKECALEHFQLLKWLQEYSNILEKQGEQKPADKVEPKFKVGDWVVNNITKDVFLIKSVNSGYCTLEDIKGNIISPCLPQCESESHLWTIQDAKDGDVLAVEPISRYKFPFIAICKNYGLNFFNSYCSIGFDGKFYEADTGHVLDNIHPATKEQRDLLFSKMKEAGYEWDAEKKELSKIEDEPVAIIPKFKVGDIIRHKEQGFTCKIIGVDTEYRVSDCCGTHLPFDCQDYYELVDENHDWSEEDERLCSCLIEEHEEALDNVENDKYGHSEIISDLKEMYNERIDWLKSLKDRVQPQWKPEDVHLEALRCVINGNNLDVIALKDLLEQLKKL